MTLMPTLPEPRHPRRLLTSKWSCCAPQDERPNGLVHFVVIGVSGDDADLQSVLSPEVTLVMPWRGLRDRARWTPGWV